MSREDKLRAMEELWTDLSKNDVEMESPSWHAEALQQTRQLVAEGKAKFHAWDDAKGRIRRKAARML